MIQFYKKYTMRKMSILIGIILLMTAGAYSQSTTVKTETMEEMMVKEVLQNYLKAMVTKDTALIGKIFNPAAQMFLVREAKLLQFPIFPGLIQYIQTTPKDPEAKGRVISFDITGTAATGKVEVISKGLVYTDYFNLIKTAGVWVIVNKTFSILPLTQ
jgi:hypothetical protein